MTSPFNADAIRVANTGQYVTGGTTIPALTPSQNTLTDFADPWVSLGVFSEDGVEHMMEEAKSEIMTWQLGRIKSIITGRKLGIKVGAMESSKAVIERYYGGEFVLTGTVPNQVAKLDIYNTQDRPVEKGVFEWIDSATGAVWRLVLDRTQIGEVENPTFNAQGALLWTMNVEAHGGGTSGAAGVIGYWETNDPDVLAALGA